MTNACKYELGKAWSAQYVIHICTVHTSAVTSLVSCELEKVQNYNVMSPKILEISQPIRSHMVTLYKNGESHRKIAKKVGFTFSAVQYVIKSFLATKSLGNDCRNSRPKTLNLTQSRSLIWNSQKNPFKSAASLTTDLVYSMGVTVHPQTVGNVLYSASIHGRYPQKKPFISEANCVKCLTFAK